MVSIDGQTAGLIGLNFFVFTHAYPGSVRLQIEILFLQHFFSFFFQEQRRPLDTEYERQNKNT